MLQGTEAVFSHWIKTVIFCKLYFFLDVLHSQIFWIVHLGVDAIKLFGRAAAWRTNIGLTITPPEQVSTTSESFKVESQECSSRKWLTGFYSNAALTDRLWNYRPWGKIINVCLLGHFWTVAVAVFGGLGFLFQSKKLLSLTLSCC